MTSTRFDHPADAHPDAHFHAVLRLALLAVGGAVGLSLDLALYSFAQWLA